MMFPFSHFMPAFLLYSTGGSGEKPPKKKWTRLVALIIVLAVVLTFFLIMAFEKDRNAVNVNYNSVVLSGDTLSLRMQYDAEGELIKFGQHTIVAKDKEFTELYIGRNGDFDIAAASATKRAQKRLDNQSSSLILTQPYHSKYDTYYESFYDEICYPISKETHPKQAITKRNQWMIDSCDLLIAYVEKDRRGGAMAALDYAMSKKIEIINLAELNQEER